MSQRLILCLQRAPTCPVSCNSGLRALTPCADSYHLFIPLPSENKINCALLVPLPGCLFRSAPQRMLPSADSSAGLLLHEDMPGWM